MFYIILTLVALAFIVLFVLQQFSITVETTEEEEKEEDETFLEIEVSIEDIGEENENSEPEPVVPPTNSRTSNSNTTPTSTSNPRRYKNKGQPRRCDDDEDDFEIGIMEGVVLTGVVTSLLEEDGNLNPENYEAVQYEEVIPATKEPEPEFKGFSGGSSGGGG